jgi:hypothetical protein
VPKCHFCPEWSGREKEKDPSCPKGTPIPIASGIKKGLTKERERDRLFRSPFISFNPVPSIHKVRKDRKKGETENTNGINRFARVGLRITFRI